jgi:two-component system chemotaxis response regulator CheY
MLKADQKMAKILIIDDSMSVRNHLSEVLRRVEHEVVEAIDGNDGLDKIAENTDLDLVISDHNMPGRDGLSMLLKAKERAPNWNIPIFMLTTETSDKLKILGKQAGVIAWIIKPFVEEKLLVAIVKVLEARKKA